jgi:hypothetical protein
MQALYTAGQLDFVNGGWCMHDEAAAHYVDMIDQTTLGHRFLKEKVGALTRRDDRGPDSFCGIASERVPVCVPTAGLRAAAWLGRRARWGGRVNSPVCRSVARECVASPSAMAPLPPRETHPVLSSHFALVVAMALFCECLPSLAPCQGPAGR